MERTSDIKQVPFTDPRSEANVFAGMFATAREEKELE
jgi:hypothetical protein